MPEPVKQYPHLERWDRDNVAYLYLREIKEGEAKTQIPIAWKAGDGPQLILDLTAAGEVLGVEFLNAREQLPDATPA